MLGLRFCARASCSCGKRGPLFLAVRGPLTIAASLIAEHRLQMRRLSSCGSRAQLLCGMWDPPRPGLEPVSPALAGRASTTAPPGKPRTAFLLLHKQTVTEPGPHWWAVAAAPWPRALGARSSPWQHQALVLGAGGLLSLLDVVGWWFLLASACSLLPGPPS